MKYSLIPYFLGLASLGLAKQPSAPDDIPVPLRDLKFGKINFLHTTDTHGWHAGHLLEAQYSADWGDYIDFSSRLREKIEAEGNDLLIVDTGDRVEGNGLYDASEPKGKYTFDIFKEQHMDLICTGNHELYQRNTSENDHRILVPAYGSSYIMSNLEIYDSQAKQFVNFAPQFKKFTTKNQGIQILAFGFLFDFSGNANNTKVELVEKTVTSEWFQRVLGDQAVDLIVVIGHASARSPEFAAIHQAIRAHKPDIPIQFIAGHQHIRAYVKYDNRAYAIASGRFLETIGFQSIDGIKGSMKPDSSAKDDTPLTFFRRYIDNNLYSFYHHSSTNKSTFHSNHGRKVSAQIEAARKAINLDERYGCSPTDIWMSRSPFPANDSIYTWLNESVLPEAVVEKDRQHKSRMIIINTGGIRFDIFKGPFTKDSASIISPFTSGMHYIKDVPFTKARQVVDLINAVQPIFQQAEINGKKLRPTWRLAPPEQWHLTSDPASEPQHPQARPQKHAAHNIEQIPLSNSFEQMIPGYTTIDDAGTDGDDSIHSPIQFYRVPNVIQSYVPSTTYTSDSTVDLIFNEFIQPYVLVALGSLGAKYTNGDVGAYLYGESMTDMIVRWIKENWEMDC